MNCEKIQPLLLDYIDGICSKESQDEIEKHILNCSVCLDELNQLKKLNNIFESTPNEQPDKTLRIDFQKALEAEKQSTYKKYTFNWLHIAAGVALLITGMFIGQFIPSPEKGIEQERIASLQKDLKETKQLVMFSMLKQESASSRIKAVGYAEEINTPDNEVIKALLNTLNKDQNVNVRLAAANSLIRFAQDKEIRDSLISSLEKQKDPLIQIILIQVLVQMQETKAVQTIKEIAKDNKNNELVIEEAKRALSKLT